MICGAHKGEFDGEAHAFQLEGKPVLLCTECFEAFSQTDQDELIRVNEESERLREDGRYNTRRVGRDRRRTQEQIEEQEQREAQREERVNARRNAGRQTRPRQHRQQQQDVQTEGPGRVFRQDDEETPYTRIYRSWSSDRRGIPLQTTPDLDYNRLMANDIASDGTFINLPETPANDTPVDRRTFNHMIRVENFIRQYNIIPDYPPFFATQPDDFINNLMLTNEPETLMQTQRVNEDEFIRRMRALIDHPHKNTPEWFKTYMEDQIDDTRRSIRPATFSKIKIECLVNPGILAAPDVIWNKYSYIQVLPSNRLQFISYDVDSIESMRLFYRDLDFRSLYNITTYHPDLRDDSSIWYIYRNYRLEDSVWLTDTHGVDTIGIIAIFEPVDVAQRTEGLAEDAQILPIHQPHRGE